MEDRDFKKGKKIKGFHTKRREKCRVAKVGGGRRRRNKWKVVGIQIDQVILWAYN